MARHSEPVHSPDELRSDAQRLGMLLDEELPDDVKYVVLCWTADAPESSVAISSASPSEASFAMRNWLRVVCTGAMPAEETADRIRP